MTSSCWTDVPRENAKANSADEPVAIVGMSCLFPGAETPSQFWENILDKVDSVTDPPPDWQPELFLDSTGSQPDRAYTGRGGYLGDLCRFDPVRFRVVPASVDGGEPDQFIALRCAHEAVEDAESSGVPLNKEKTGVVLGRGTFVNRGYVSLHQHAFFVDQTLSVIRQLDLGLGEDELSEIRAALKRNLPPLGPDIVPGLSHSVIVGRIANRLDLHGPAYTLDAACASSLLAVEQASQELRSRRCDAMIAGGVQVSTPAILAILFCQLEALSRTGSISPFSAEANGTLLGEGCGMVVLKRREDALRDGNRIYALIRAVGVSSDGKGAGILAPLQEGQELSISRAYEASGISPHTVGLIEAHGTGIPLGDATELRSLMASFGAGADGRRIALGSVKSMISHLIPAAGIASLIKTALALHHRVLPPTLHAATPNPDLKLEETPFYVSTESRPWIHGDREQPRRAGVDAFGFGGINTHAVLEEHRESELDSFPLYRKWPVELVVVSAEDRRGLREKVARIARWAGRSEGVSLLDLAASTARQSGRCRIAICAKSLSELKEKLERAAKLLSETERDRIQMRSGVFWYDAPLKPGGKLALVFPGEGAQYVNMLRELALHFPEVRRQFDLAEQALAGLELDAPPSRAIFPPPNDVELAERRIFDARVAVESVATANRAALALVGSLGIRADAAVGHSSGEFGALLAAGAIELSRESDLIEAIQRGARCAEQIMASGSLDSVVLTTVGGSSSEAVHQVVSEYPGLEIAMDNCPHQLVLVGDLESTDAAVRKLSSLGALCERLPWDRPYHTHRFAPACEILRAYYDRFRVQRPAFQVWSCAAAAPYPEEPEAIRELAVRQWRSKVRFRETVVAMYDSGVRIFLEVGARGNLTSFINDVLSEDPHAAVPLDLPRKPGLEQLCRALGMMVAHGVTVDLEALYRRRQPRLVDLDKDPEARVPRPPLLKKEFPVLSISEESLRSLKNRRTPEAATSIGRHDGVSATSLDPRLEALRGYQQTMRRFLETQTRVMSVAARAASVQAGSPLTEGVSVAGASLALADAPVPGTAGRWLHRVVSRDGDSRLVAECELDVERHAFLGDHTFGRKVSDLSASLTALPVMPLAMTMELMAEAAEALRTGSRVSGMRNVRALRWLAFDEPRCQVRIEADGIDRQSVRVVVYERRNGGPAAALAEAIVDVSDSPLPERSATLPVETSRPSRWSSHELYGRGMFHGPAFQSVRSMDGCGERGIRATLQETDPSLLLPQSGAGALSLPVSLIDGVGQVLGLWLGEKDLAMGFPTGMDALQLGSSKSSGPFEAVLRVEPRSPGVFTSDAEVRTTDGRVVLRIDGRRERLLPVPSHIWRYRAAPHEVVFSRAFENGFAELPMQGLVACELDDFHRAFLLEDGAFWALVLSRLALGGRERPIYDRYPGPKPDAISWLLGRVVAKDAARLLDSLQLCMADVEIRTDERGRESATLGEAEGALVSLCHKGLDAVAVACDPRVFDGVGIAIEPLPKLEPSAFHDGFTAEERRAIDEAAALSGELSDVAYAAARGAREAARKALGFTSQGSPADVRIEAVDPATGSISATFQGPLSRGAGGGLARRSVSVSRSLRGQSVVSLCVLKREGRRM